MKLQKMFCKIFPKITEFNLHSHNNKMMLIDIYNLEKYMFIHTYTHYFFHKK